jgi:phosphoribosylformylglycinamidine synthase
MDFIGQEAEEGKVVIGNCNGAQILVESGLIPLDKGLRMSLARNVVHTSEGYRAPGFLSEWVWIRPSCPGSRCATADWEGVMHLPIAHGEGRFITEDKDVADELRKNDQIAFSYCDGEGIISLDPLVTPNGAMFSAAGICNPAGNVIALMPHPERTGNGIPYFDSLKRWIEQGRTVKAHNMHKSNTISSELPIHSSSGMEIFIDTIIVNNEERTVEQTGRKFVPDLRLKQWKYLASESLSPSQILSDLSTYNSNKERAYIRRKGKFFRWDAAMKQEVLLNDELSNELLAGVALLRRDLPDTGAASLGEGGASGVCYVCSGVAHDRILEPSLLAVFANPHASQLSILK